MDPFWEVTLKVQLSRVQFAQNPQGQEALDVPAVQTNEFRGRGETALKAYEQAVEGVKGMSLLLRAPGAPPES
jgi:hypothetical protein